MKKLFIPLLLMALLPIVFSCNSLKKAAGYTLNEKDAAKALRQLLEMGTKESLNGAFSKETITTALFPQPIRKALNTLQQLGLSNEVDRFTITLSTASEKTAANSVPIFVDAIHNIKFTDAMSIIKNGGTSATDYLRSSVGDNVRHAIAPVMQTALDEYHLNEQWDKIIGPVKGIVGNKLNLDLPNLMAGVVSERMFEKIADKEKEIRINPAARTTPLLQKFFSKTWN
jgi:hypothetical protein